MRMLLEILAIGIGSAVIFVMANCRALAVAHSGFLWILIMAICYIWLMISPSMANRRLFTKKLKHLADGRDLLLMFLLSVTASVIWNIMGISGGLVGRGYPAWHSDYKVWIWNIIIVVLLEAAVFWNGIIRVYLTSGQLGIRWRVLGGICGWIPLLNIIMLGVIIKVVTSEIRFEEYRFRLDEGRKAQELCKTKYPILMVHGVFFRDFRYLNYWGRVPQTLETNGATIYYGNHQSAASVADCGRELAERIQYIVETTGCEKVNIIAHSKGGLDSRYALAKLGVSQYVASLTTINTPHRGCEFADYLLQKIPDREKQVVANTYNLALSKLGDPNPDFIAAVTDLTASACRAFNAEVFDAEGVYYQSVGSKLNVAKSGRFPLNFTYRLVDAFDGANDGLVGEDSFVWGENFRFLTVRGKRGISHGDMIDLNRENIKEFDVREFYVGLVHELKEKGM